MGRLTQKDEQGNWSLKGVKWEQLYVGQSITQEVWEKLYGALWKLMEYENTGLEPEEVEALNTFDGSQAMQATAKLQEEQRKHRWIPVVERLPGTERILITNGEVIKEGYRRPDGVWKYGAKEDELFLNLSSHPVVAWMPLPEPYGAQD